GPDRPGDVLHTKALGIRTATAAMTDSSFHIISTSLSWDVSRNFITMNKTQAGDVHLGGPRRRQFPHHLLMIFILYNPLNCKKLIFFILSVETIPYIIASVTVSECQFTK
ncbi:unnamed protein product, partial [Amoebophrya sp. A120]